MAELNACGLLALLETVREAARAGVPIACPTCGGVVRVVDVTTGAVQWTCHRMESAND